MKIIKNLAYFLLYLLISIEIPLRAGFLSHHYTLGVINLSFLGPIAEIIILFFIGILMFPRVLKSIKGLDLQHDFNPVAVKTFLCGMGVLVLSHWVACGWIALRISSKDEPFVLYIKSLYWSVTSLTTVGYGDIVPENTVQYAYAIVVMLIGIGMYAFIVGLIASFLTHRDHVLSAHRERLERLRSYLHYHKVPSHMRQRIWDYYDYLWSNKLGSEQFNMLAEIPEPIKTEVAAFLVGDLLKSSEIFQTATPELVNYLAPKLKFRLSMPEETIVREGAAADEMYFISKGEVQVFKSGKAITKLGTGEHFGEMALINEQSRRNATITALSVVEHYAIGRKDFLDALKLFPDFAEQIKLTASRRAELKVKEE